MPEKTRSLRRLPERPEKPPPPPHPSSSHNAPANGRNADRDLFKNLVEIVPLVESLMDRRANPSFKRRASMAYTPAPKVLDPKGKRTAQAASATKQRNHGDSISNGHAQTQENPDDSFLIFSSRASTEEDVQENMEELTTLREQLDNLHKMVSEKDDALTSVEEPMSQMTSVYSALDELRRETADKEFLLSSTNSQLLNAEIKLDERQAALEKLELEATTSRKKVQELQEDLDSMDFEKFAIMLLFQELSKNDSATYSQGNITSFPDFVHLPLIDNVHDNEKRQMEDARLAYIAAVAVAKENPCDESIAAATDARLKLEAFVF